MSFNKVILMGNLTRDPELRQTQSGTSICKFSIAVGRKCICNDGTARDETCFVEIDCFGKIAENISKYFRKGMPILVEGRLKQDTWEEKETGKKRSKLSVALERFGFVGGKSEDARAERPQEERRVVQQELPKGGWEDNDDDVPF